MKKILASLLIVLLILTALPTAAFAFQDANEPAGPYVEDELLVKFNNGADSNSKKNAHAIANAEAHGKIDKLDIEIVKVNRGQAKKALEEYKKNSDVEYVEYNYILTPEQTPNDAKFASQTYLAPANASKAWDINVGSSSVTVAVIDTGVDVNHADLKGRLTSGYNFYGGNTDPSDVYGHGTKVVGIIAASSNNTVGITGMDWGCNVMPLRIGDDSGMGTVSRMANALIYASDNGARVVNISMGSPTSSITMLNAVNYAESRGVVVVAATGNSNTTVSYPAAYPTVLGVGNVTTTGSRYSSSNYGEGLDVCAVGVSTYTTIMGSSYGSGTGTSFSSPQVAALVSLMLSANPGLSPSDVRRIITSTAKNGGAWNAQTGYGQIDMEAALIAAGGSAAPVEPELPPEETFVPEEPVVAPEEPTAMPDTIPPVISVTGSTGIVLHIDSPYTEQGATAFDNTDGDISHMVMAQGFVDVYTPGTYNVTYTVSDTAGNTAVAIRTIRVISPTTVFNTPTLKFDGSLRKNGSGVHQIVAESDGLVDMMASLDCGSGKNAGMVHVSVTDANGIQIMSRDDLGSFSTQFYLTAGTYSLEFTLASGNSASYSVSIQMPQTVYEQFDEPEVPLGELPEDVHQNNYIVPVSALLLVAIIMIAIFISKRKRT